MKAAQIKIAADGSSWRYGPAVSFIGVALAVQPAATTYASLRLKIPAFYAAIALAT